MATLLAIAAVLSFHPVGDALCADTLFVAGRAFGSFEQAARITIGPQGRVYIIDSKKNAVLIFDSKDKDPYVLGGFGWSSTSFDRPTGVTTDGLNIYVSDYGNHRIQRFDRYSNLLSSLFTRDTSYAPARFGYPAGVALTTLGDLLILDSENLRIVEYSSDSRFERDLGGLNTSGGTLEDPVKVCVGGDQYIYALEKKRILEFDYFGNYLGTFGNSLGGDIVGGQATSTGIAVVSADTMYQFDASGALESKLAFSTLIAEEPIRMVRDIAFDATTIYVLTPTRCYPFTIDARIR